MLTTLLLIRHGESTWNREGRVQGWFDPPLSERGLQQFALLAERLREQHIDALYASPLQRARATALAIAKLKGLPLRVYKRLREHRPGGIQGLTGDEIASKFPQLHVFHRDNTSITRVRLRGALVQVMALHDCSHLHELTAPVDLQSL